MKFVTIINLLYFHLKLSGSSYLDHTDIDYYFNQEETTDGSSNLDHIDEDDYVNQEEITYLEKPLLRKYQDLFLSCPSIKLHNGKVEYLFSRKHVASFYCHHPFILVGDDETVCKYGHWSPQPPTCASTNCTSLSPPEHSKFTMSEDNTTATFKCDSERYQLVGPTTLICTERGWNDQVPTCRDLFPSCPPIELHNGNLEYFSDEQKVMFSCHHPFILVGDNSAVCQSGNWSSLPPTCASTNCTSLSSPEHGRLTMSEDNTTATITCDIVRYQLVGPTTLICTEQGWNNQVPTCRETDTSSNLLVYILVILSTLLLISIAISMRRRHKNYLESRENYVLSNSNHPSLPANEI